MTHELKQELLRFLDSDPASRVASTDAEPDVGTIFANAVREITDENPELAVLAKAIRRSHHRQTVTKRQQPLSGLLATAIQCAQEFYRSAVGVADALNALPQAAEVADLWVAIPAVDLSGKAHAKKPQKDRLDSDYVVEIDGDELRFRCPASKLPYGLLLVYIFDASNQNRLVAVHPLVAFEAEGHWSVHVPLVDLDLLNRSTALQARVIAATADTAAMFQRERIVALRQHCPDRKSAELLGEFLKLVPENGDAQT